MTLRASAAADHAGVHGDALFQIGELGDFDQLPGKFENGAGTLFEIESGMGGAAFHLERVIADAFAGGFQRAF